MKDKTSCNDKQRLNDVKRIYFTHRQISASEAVYRLLPTLKLKDSNLKTKFVTTGLPENRSVMFLPKIKEDDDEDEDEETDDNEHFYSITGKKGMYKKVRTIHEHYADRPEKLEKMCLAKFATIYETCKMPKKTIFMGQISKDDSKKYNQEQLFAYGEKVPKYILLGNGQCMMKRGSNAVLRIHSSKKKKGFEEQYSELLLFFPWRDESDLMSDSSESVVRLFNENIEIILQNRKDVLPFSSMVTEMRNYLANPEDMRSLHVFDTLDSNLEQQDDDDYEIQESLDDTPVVAEEDDIHQIQNKSDGMGNKFKIPQVDDNETMRKLVHSMSAEQRLVFDTIIDYTKKLTASKKHATIDFLPPRLIVHGKLNEIISMPN